MIYIGVFFVLINMVSFSLFGRDKRKATTQRWRISENTLLLSVACGGWLGAVLGMSLFHHKTIKSSFLRKFRLIVFVRICITSLVSLQ